MARRATPLAAAALALELLRALDELRHSPPALAPDLLEVLRRVALAHGLAALLPDLGEELGPVARARGTAALAPGVANAHRLRLALLLVVVSHDGLLHDRSVARPATAGSRTEQA